MWNTRNIVRTKGKNVMKYHQAPYKVACGQIGVMWRTTQYRACSHHTQFFPQCLWEAEGQWGKDVGPVIAAAITSSEQISLSTLKILGPNPIPIEPLTTLWSVHLAWFWPYRIAWALHGPNTKVFIFTWWYQDRSKYLHEFWTNKSWFLSI